MEPANVPLMSSRHLYTGENDVLYLTMDTTAAFIDSELLHRGVI